MATQIQATINDLYCAPGKAELVGGRIVMMSPGGDAHGSAAGAIYASLRTYQAAHAGRAYPDNVGFLTELPHRSSFSPDAAWYTGPRSGRQFLPQAPDFAVEIRSEGDYGPAAEARLKEKRSDYFAAGMLVVWDVDLVGMDVVRVFRAERPDEPAIFRCGETAAAEPAVPGWTMRVDELFE